VRFRTQQNANDAELATARARVTDELVHFAEKLLFLANNQVLLQDPHTSSRDGGAEVLYPRLLQSVGNAILVQVDELDRVAQYRRETQKTWEREVRAFQAIAADSVHGVISRVAERLGIEQDSARASSRAMTQKAADAEQASTRFDADAKKAQQALTAEEANEAPTETSPQNRDAGETRRRGCGAGGG
jgi:hypothetical protein